VAKGRAGLLCSVARGPGIVVAGDARTFAGNGERTRRTIGLRRAGLVGAMILLSVAIALWWWRARDQKRTVAASIDAVFAFTLLYILVSEVLSPQYLIWLIGIAAARLCLSPTKPVWWLALFALAVWLNGLMVDHWSDLVGEGGAGVVLLVGRNAILVVVAILSLSQVWRAARTQSVETIEATPAHAAAT